MSKSAIKWTPSYEKTFEAPDALDELKLSHIWDNVINNEEQQYAEDCVTLGAHPKTDDPCMIITCKKTPDTEEAQKLANGQPYLSGIATSYTSADFGPFFKIEGDIWLPKGMGLWPAFWLLSLGKNEQWPEGQDYLHEIDPLEKLGREAGDWIHCTSHLLPGPWDSPEHKHWPNAIQVNANTYEGFHRYGTAICPSGVYFYFDGKEVCKNPLPDEYKTLKWHWLANVAMGGGWAQSPDETTPEESHMYVRSIKAWEMGGKDGRSQVDTLDSANNNLAAKSLDPPAPGAPPAPKPDDKHAGIDPPKPAAAPAPATAPAPAPTSAPAPTPESTPEPEKVASAPVAASDSGQRVITQTGDELSWPTHDGETRWNVYRDGEYVTTESLPLHKVAEPGVYVIEGISDPTPALKVG